MSLEQASTTPSTTTTAAFPIAETTPLIDAAALAHVIAITEEIFAAKPSIETMVDPDDPDETPFLVFTVECRGENKDLIQRHIQWHQRLDELNSDLSLRLSIIPLI